MRNQSLSQRPGVNEVDSALGFDLLCDSTVTVSVEEPMLRVVRFLSVAAVVGMLSACKDTSTPTPVATPTAIQVSASSSAALDALQATQTLTATVTASDGKALTDLVTWQSDAPTVVGVTGSGNSATATAIANGTARVTGRTSNGITSSPVTITVQQVATKLSRVSGDAQTAPVNTKLTGSLVVLVTDRNDNPTAGASVQFTPSAGVVGTTVATTGTNGQASSTWTLSTVASAQTVTAALTSNSSTNATFSATATAGPAQRLIKIDGDAQRGSISAALSSPIIAGVVDQFGNGVAGVTVTLAPQAGSGSVSPGSISSIAGGQAQATWTLGPAASSNQTITASATGLTGSPLSFTATALNASLDNLGPSPFKGGCKISGILSGVIVADKPRISVTVNGVSVAQADFTLLAAGSTAVSINITVPTLPLATATVVPVIVRVYSQNVQAAAGPVT
ncbi:MAG: hypothetical protein ABJB66_16200, partial [Gemmatimonadaceae bacterium]